MGKLSFTVEGSDDPRGIHDDPERARTGPRFGSDEFNRLDVLAEPIGDDQVLETEAVESAVHPEVEIDLRDSPRDEFMSLLTGRLAVVTGANDAVGRAVALALIDAGARVCVLGRDAHHLRAIVEEAAPDAEVVSLQCDLGSASEVRSAAEFVNRFDRPIDVLVHCANVHVRGSIGHSEIADLDEQYLVNLRGPFLLTQALLAGISEGPGHVVFVNPTEPEGAGSNDTQYAMSRSGISALAQGLREETAGLGVRVTTVHVSGRVDDGRDNSLSPDDIADCVLGAIEMPHRIEVSDLMVRPRVAPSLVS